MATNTQIPPTSQLNRNIFFCLRDKAKSGAVGHLMSVNPEDLTVTSPSRLAVQQTMGGAWVDNFGPGLRTITISGNTGWRAKYDAGRDWAAEYASLHQEAFEGWHTQRALKVHAGNNPDDITMEFVDVLDKCELYEEYTPGEGYDFDAEHLKGELKKEEEAVMVVRF